MKLLLDNNLSPKLVAQLANVYPVTSHVTLLGLQTASDIEVWEAAQKDG
jgi:predicted nuclease of predicted toxin-antitoxin system